MGFNSEWSRSIKIMSYHKKRKSNLKVKVLSVGSGA